MKNILLPAVTLLTSSVAFAMPSVGDQALYDATLSKAGAVTAATAELELVSLDAANQQFQEKTTIVANGATQSNTKTVEASSLASDEIVTQVLATCSEIGGHLETITVPAGTFDTCALPSDASTPGTYWVSHVSFGVVKQDFTNSSGVHIVMVLRSFRKGH